MQVWLRRRTRTVAMNAATVVDRQRSNNFELRPAQDQQNRGTTNKMGAMPTSLQDPRTDTADGKHRSHVDCNPYSVVFESGCKLHPTGNYSSKFFLDDPYRLGDLCCDADDLGYTGFGHNAFYCKHHNNGGTTRPLPPPPLSAPVAPSSPRVYFQKLTARPQPKSEDYEQPSSPSRSPCVQQPDPARYLRSISEGGGFPDINRNPTKVVEMDVFLKNHIVVKLEVLNGQMATCRDLIALILEEPEVGIPKEAEELFALWLVSPLFEVQLKADHRPLNIWRRWPELLSKYTATNPSQREKDQPYLSFQRDVFYPLHDEIRLATVTVLELLYEEAKSNVLLGRYPSDQATVERMAGMQARIELGKFDPEVHTPAYIKSRMESFLPCHACKPKWSFFNFGSKSGLEYRVWLQFRNASDDLSMHSVMRQYLQLCWSLPFYGSAFFVGQLEKPVTGLAALIGYRDLPVTIAIGSEGVTILSQAEGQVLLGLKYQELSWDSARPAQENNPNCLPCLFLQFQIVEGGQRVFKVLQVFSKQAILMDAIISSFVRALRQRSWERDEVDDSSAATPGECTPEGDDVQTPLTTNSMYTTATYGNESEACLNSKLHRLSLATFNEDGDCINLMGSWAFR